MKAILFLMITIFVFSCKEKRENIASRLTEGLWVVDTIYYEKKDMNACVNFNMMTFNENSSASVASIDKSCFLRYQNCNDRNARWKIIKKDNIIKLQIDSKNQFFNQYFDLSFKLYPAKNTIKIILETKSIKIIASKVFGGNSKIYKDVENFEKN